MTGIAQHDVTIHQGDALDVLRTLPDQSAQCIVTSPPYYGLRDYGVDGQLGLEPSPAEYVAAMVGVFREARRVLANDGTFWLNIGDSYSTGQVRNLGRNDAGRDFGTGTTGQGPGASPGRQGSVALTDATPAKNLMGIPWRTAFGLQDDGWTLRNAIIWNKPNAMPESVTDRMSCRYEHVFLFSKSRRYRFDVDPIKIPTQQRASGKTAKSAAAYGAATGVEQASRRFGGNATSTLGTFEQSQRNPGDVWTIPTSPFPGAHFATMPPELVRRCILAGCPEGGTVLDPFTGSGTTAMVARNLGRKFVGAELNPAYFPIIEKRIGQEPFAFEGTA